MPAPADPPDPLDRWGAFADPATEDRFRQAFTAADARVLQVVVLVTLVGSLVFAFTDFQQPAALPALLASRLSLVAGSAFVAWRLTRPIAPARFLGLTGLWLLLLAAQNLSTQLARPPGHLGHAVTTVCIVMLTYGAVPLPARFQALAAGGHSALCLLVATVVNPAGDPAFLRALGMGLVGGNLLGVLASRMLHGRARRLFVALERQAELSARLEAALAEVRTLRGLIRICAWCKGIHADGEWQKLEQYFGADGQASFTHGICPTCLAEQMADTRRINLTRP